MVIKRTAIGLLAAGALLLLVARAVAQPAHSNLHYQVPHPTYENGPAPFSDDTPGPHHAISPFKPVGFEPQFDWFAPAETSGYGRGLRPHIGYFFSYERLFWSMSSPEHAYVGSTTADPFFLDAFFSNGPSVDNSWIGATGGWGNRWELGYTDTDDYGWLFSVLDHVSQGQYRTDFSPAFLFGDPGFLLWGSVPVQIPDTDPAEFTRVLVPVPYIFGEFRMQNILQLNGLEITRFYRARRLHSGAYFELLYGARWFQLNDAFIVQGDGNGTTSESSSISIGGPFTTYTTPTNILDASIWSNRALNNLVGPQIGARFFVQRGRWVTSLETRFLAAANFQNLHLKARLGDQTIDNQNAINENIFTFFRGLGVDTHQYKTTFSPLGELRVNVSYQVTRNVGLKVGYTGMVVGNVSRASNTIDYDDINLVGIKHTNFDQLFFVNGLNFGFEINR
jgi:hypothetical protein